MPELLDGSLSLPGVVNASEAEKGGTSERVCLLELGAGPGLRLET